MLKLKLQYFGHLMGRTDSFEKTWCWKRLKSGGEGDNRGWDGWMASPTQWTWVCVSSRCWWWTKRPGVLQSMGSQIVGHDWTIELTNWLSLMFRSLIHFEFIFVYGVRKCSKFILLHVAVQFSQCHLLKRFSLPHCIFLPPLSKIRHPEVHGLISGLFILSYWSIFLFFVPIPYCLDDCSFVV